MIDKKSQIRKLMYSNEGAVVLAGDIARIVDFYLDDHAKKGDTKDALEALSKYVEKVQAVLKFIEGEGF